jgi:hypothetical protein
LSEIDVDGPILRYFLVEWIGVYDRAVFHTGGATRAFILQDVSGLPNQGYPEVSCLSFHTVNVRVGQDFYVGVPADLDQFGCKNSNGAVVGGKGLVKLGHVATYGRSLVHQIDLEARGSEIKRGLNATDASTDDHHITEMIAFEALANTVCETPTNLILTSFWFSFHL